MVVGLANCVRTRGCRTLQSTQHRPTHLPWSQAGGDTRMDQPWLILRIYLFVTNNLLITPSCLSSSDTEPLSQKCTLREQSFYQVAPKPWDRAGSTA